MATPVMIYHKAYYIVFANFHSTITSCCFLPSTVSKLLISISVCITDTAHPANLNPLRYRGYYYDSETGFYYVSSRYYDPEIGRFINADDAEYLGADGRC